MLLDIAGVWDALLCLCVDLNPSQSVLAGYNSVPPPSPKDSFQDPQRIPKLEVVILQYPMGIGLRIHYRCPNPWVSSPL